MALDFMHASRGQIVLDDLDAQNRRLNKTDRERKYRKMSASPFSFFRGSNHLYWADVWNDWRYYLFGGLPDTQTWLQGDAHVYNHGAYGDDRQGLHYGMDDFDDALIGDYQFDLWRQVASMVLDVEEHVGLSGDQTRRCIRHLLAEYLDTLEAHAGGESPNDIHVAYMNKPLGPFMDKVGKKRGVARQLDKWTVVDDDGKRRLDVEGNDKLGALSASRRSQLLKALDEEYPDTLQTETIEGHRAHFRVKDVAARLDAGTGSLGLWRYYALVEGDSRDEHDDVLLDIKQQTPPAAYPYMNDAEKRAWRRAFRHEAERHAFAFRALANQVDEYVGWLTLGKTRFSVRRRSPYKKDFPTDKVSGFKQYRRLSRQWGRILAREHIRGAHALRPDDPGYFCRAVTARCDGQRQAFKRMLVDLAFNYARCVRGDFEVFLNERGYPD